MTDLVRVGVVQMRSAITPDENITAIKKLVDAAVLGGASYVLTPEVSVAYAKDRAQMATVAVPFKDNPAIAALAAMAREHQIFLHLGSLAVLLDDGMFANRSVLFDPDGAIIATYDKIHLFDADPPDDRPYRESASYIGGDVAVVADVAGFKLGLSICYDMRYPALYAMLATAGAEVLAVPAAFTVPTGRAHWDVLLRARAIETGSYVLAAAQGGIHENGRATWGHSMIIDPWGQVIASIEGDDPGVIYANIDIKVVLDARIRLPTLANCRQFSLSVNPKLSH